MAPDELGIIDRYFRPLSGEGAFRLLDDAATLSVPSGCDLVVTKDMIAAGVHFLPDDPPDTIARKALRVNLSDLSAKGAKPLAYLLGAGFDRDICEEWLAEFARGLGEDQRLFGIHLLGGDTISVQAGPVISITALGAVAGGRMVHRFGGRPGDALYLSGTMGGAAAGLELLKGTPGLWGVLRNEEREGLIARYRVPEPRTGLADAIAGFASAAIDVSDGLIGDCDKLAAASGCTAAIEADKVPLPPELGSEADESLLPMLLTGGDDYEILAAVPPANEARFSSAARDAGIQVTRIGMLREGSGLTSVFLNGSALALERRSFVHGRGAGI